MLVANKAVTLGGKPYKAGDKVDASLLAPGKAEQLVAQRVLRDTDAAHPKACVVLRDAVINGKSIKRGTRVAVTRLPLNKLAQMLDHRILGPAMPA